jgi:hypothetical protein
MHLLIYRLQSNLHPLRPWLSKELALELLLVDHFRTQSQTKQSMTAWKTSSLVSDLFLCIQEASQCLSQWLFPPLWSGSTSSMASHLHHKETWLQRGNNSTKISTYDAIV